jgi:hypothetical protein
MKESINAWTDENEAQWKQQIRQLFTSKLREDLLKDEKMLLELRFIRRQ